MALIPLNKHGLKAEVDSLSSSTLIFFFFFFSVDRVFSIDSDTRQVYEEAAKEVALSVLSGINCEFVSPSSPFFLHKNKLPWNFYIGLFGL